MKTSYLMLAIVVLLQLSGAIRTARAQEATLLQDIRMAWQLRQANTQKLTASWTVEGAFGFQDAAAPVDPEPTPHHESLNLSGDSLRFERTYRYYDIDGGPRGSMSWQTSILAETFSPVDGWRKLLQNTLPTIRGSAYVNRPGMLAFTGLDRRGLFLFWFRGMIDELTLSQFDNWIVSKDPRFQSSDGSQVVLLQSNPGQQFKALYLDAALDYLPVASRHGPMPSPEQSLSEFEECSVQLDSEARMRGEIRPLVWMSQRFRNGNWGTRPTIATLTHLQLECALSDKEFVLEFPTGLEVTDEAMAHVPASSAPGANARDSARSTSKHAMHWGYWTGLGFMGFLLVVFIQKTRRRP